MKKLIILTAAIFLFHPADVFAQKSETLFSNEIDHGGFGALIYGATSVNGKLTYLRGIRGAWVINLNNGHSVNLGLGRYRTQNEFEPTEWNTPDVDKPDMDTHYGGFELEYVHRTHRLFHFSIQMLVGSGTVDYDDRDLELDRTHDNYFVLQPGVNLNLNVTNWFRLSGGLFYRYTNGVDLQGTSNRDLSGFSSFVALRFGWF